MPRADTWDKIISSSCPRVDDGNELDIAIAPGTKTTDYFVPRPPRFNTLLRCIPAAVALALLYAPFFPTAAGRLPKGTAF